MRLRNRSWLWGFLGRPVLWGRQVDLTLGSGCGQVWRNVRGPPTFSCSPCTCWPPSLSLKLWAPLPAASCSSMSRSWAQLHIPGEGSGHPRTIATVLHLHNDCLCPFGVDQLSYERVLTVSTAGLSFHCVICTCILAF